LTAFGGNFLKFVLEEFSKVHVYRFLGSSLPRMSIKPKKKKKTAFKLLLAFVRKEKKILLACFDNIAPT